MELMADLSMWDVVVLAAGFGAFFRIGWEFTGLLGWCLMASFLEWFEPKEKKP